VKTPPQRLPCPATTVEGSYAAANFTYLDHRVSDWRQPNYKRDLVSGEARPSWA